MARHRTVASDSALERLYRALKENRKAWHPRLRRVRLVGRSLHLHYVEPDGTRQETILTPVTGQPKQRPHS